MNILKSYTDKVAKIVFASKMDRDDFETAFYPTYAFTVPKEIEETLIPGDYVVIECVQGLKTGVFVEFSRKKIDIELATRPVVCKIPGYTVDNKIE